MAPTGSLEYFIAMFMRRFSLCETAVHGGDLAFGSWLKASILSPLFLDNGPIGGHAGSATLCQRATSPQPSFSNPWGRAAIDQTIKHSVPVIEMARLLRLRHTVDCCCL
jgi:hypothetical protein